jgi:predicted ArsR family transcriptional regulator
MPFEKRQLTDARVMRALAHPTRIDLMELVAREGELTATAAADALGLSPANCSFHLRQLAKYGFLEEAPPGPGRIRPWRIGSVQHSWDELGPDAEANAAASALTSVVLERDLDRLRDWLDRQRTAEPEWRKSAFMSEALTYLTPAELEELGERVTELVLRYVDRVDPAKRPEGSAPVQVLAVGFPLRPTPTGN